MNKKDVIDNKSFWKTIKAFLLDIRFIENTFLISFSDRYKFHERFLQIIYNDKQEIFQEFLEKKNLSDTSPLSRISTNTSNANVQSNQGFSIRHFFECFQYKKTN